LKELRAGERLQYRFRFPANLGAGSYSMSIALHTADTHIAKNFEWRDLAMVFEVINADKDNFVGLAWLPPEMECRR
jgi:lipopolysaccharide transport system ATP-binding protein